MKGKVHAMPDNNRLRMVPCKGVGVVLLLLLAWLGGPTAPCRAGVPLVSLVEVTDVTPASFAVTWLSSEPAHGSLLLFAADCVTPLANPSLVSEGSDRSGFIKVTASALAARTSYCYQTVTVSKSSAETTLYPLNRATTVTEKSVVRTITVNGTSVPFANDLLAVPPPYAPTVADGQDGLLVILNMLDGKGNTPLSQLLTADSAKNYFNMNNIFASVIGESVNLTGGERVKITERHGNVGCTAITRFRKVPADGEITRERNFSRCGRSDDIDCNDTVNILDILRITRGVGSTRGDICFNSDLDINSDGSVTQLDVDAAVGGFNATP